MIPVREVMSTEVKYITSDVPVYEAIEMLKKCRVSGLPVVDQEMNVVGILTEKDVLKILFDNNPDVHNTVEKYMTREVICFAENDDVFEICKFFVRSVIRRVPIVCEGKLVGIVSRRDIVSLILEAKSKFSELRYV